MSVLSKCHLFKLHLLVGILFFLTTALLEACYVSSTMLIFFAYISLVNSPSCWMSQALLFSYQCDILISLFTVISWLVFNVFNRHLLSIYLCQEVCQIYQREQNSQGFCSWKGGEGHEVIIQMNVINTQVSEVDGHQRELWKSSL